jgi:hypothetical protein
MEWFSLLLGVLLGAFFSWLFTHLYYVKSSKEQKELYGKLSKNVRTAILENPSDNIRQDELITILEQIKNAPIDTSRLRGVIDGGTF